MLLVLAACAPQQRGPALWRLADADSEIVLFGSVHLLPEGLDWRTPELEAALAAADVVYFEAPIDEDPAVTFRLVRDLGFLPPGRPLTGMLAPEDAARFDRQAAALALPTAELQRMRPWLAGLAFAEAHAGRQGIVREFGVEAILHPQVVAAGKPIRVFADSERQLRYLADLPEPVQLRFLTAGLAEIEADTDADDNARLNRLWATGDTAGLAALLEQSVAKAGSEVREALLVGRNRVWVEEIERLHAGAGRTLIIVGAGHLVGPDSVIALLRAKGYRVEGP